MVDVNYPDQGNCRQPLKAHCKIEDVSQMVYLVLTQNLFSATEKVANSEPLLLRVVKGFKKANAENQVKEWIEAPEPTD